MRDPLPRRGVFRPSSSCFRGSGLLFLGWLFHGFLVLLGRPRGPAFHVLSTLCAYVLSVGSVWSIALTSFKYPACSWPAASSSLFLLAITLTRVHSRACPRGHGGWEVSVSCGNRHWCFRRRVDKGWGWEKGGITFIFSSQLHEAY